MLTEGSTAGEESGKTPWTMLFGDWRAGGVLVSLKVRVGLY